MHVKISRDELIMLVRSALFVVTTLYLSLNKHMIDLMKLCLYDLLDLGAERV